MTAGRILVFQKVDGNSNKFYTMIMTNSTNFVCNYGINDGKGWNKSIEKNEYLWDSATIDRRKHGYTCVHKSNIDYQMYSKCLQQMNQLRSLYGERDETVMFLMYSLMKFGKMSAAEMTQVNVLYKVAKDKLKGF